MKRLTALSAALLLAGCATMSQDGGFSSVQGLAKERIGADLRLVRTEADASHLRAEITQRLAEPLTVDQAVAIAVLANPGLQATYADLGIAESDLVQATRLS